MDLWKTLKKTEELQPVPTKPGPTTMGMELWGIYCVGCGGIVAEAYAKKDSNVAKGRCLDEYYCDDCAEGN